MMEGDVNEATAYTKYEWDCPECSEVNSCESDPSGETLECDDCGEPCYIGETR